MTTGNEPQIGPRPVGPVAKISPARKGWETDRQDCGALEARHYQHSGCRASGARTMLRNRCPSLPGWADFGYRPYGPESDLRFIAGSHSLSGLGLLLAVPVRQTQGKLYARVLMRSVLMKPHALRVLFTLVLFG